MVVEADQPTPAVRRTHAVSSSGFVTVMAIDLVAAGAEGPDDTLALFYGFEDPRPRPRRSWPGTGHAWAYEVEFSAGPPAVSISGLLRGVVVESTLWLVIVAGPEGSPLAAGEGGAMAVWNGVKIAPP
jgi:hypothetical protein